MAKTQKNKATSFHLGNRTTCKAVDDIEINNVL